MNIKAKGSVTIPKMPRNIGALMQWAKSVNTALQQLRDRTWTVPARSGGSGAAAVTTCPFGSITTYADGETTATGILGGIIYCGESNIEVPNQELNLEADGDWLVWIEIDCIANRDDDNEIFLPGMTSATAPASDWDKVTWSESASYPDNTNPTVATGAGSIIVPIGRLKIEDGSATLVNTGCGHIRIDQCAGILTHTRG